MLQENASLESLTIRKYRCYRIDAEQYVALVTLLQHNTTLKNRILGYYSNALRLTVDEGKQMALLLQKNYALERLPDINPSFDGDVGTILRLNEAGRRYLIEDGSSISKGVEVLSRVKSSINCVFLHLLENPRLCDRRAVEMLAAGDSIGKSTDMTASSSGGGKRKQASAHTG